MKKRYFVILLSLVLILLLEGCGCKHEWYAATCSAPKTCSLCAETEGEALPHTWLDATCTVAKTCSVCKATEGEPLPHTWQEATCTVAKTCTVCQVTEGETADHTWQEATCSAPKTCTVCQVTEGKTADHTWQEATCSAPKTCSICNAQKGKPASHKWQEATTEAPKTCSVCKKTDGSKLKTDSRFTTKATKGLQGTWNTILPFTGEMMGLNGFGNVDVIMTLKFGNTGKLSVSMKIKDEKSFITKLKKFTVEDTYASFEQEGYSRTEADQAMLDTYGLNVTQYVDAVLEGFDVNTLLAAYTSEEVYYVEGKQLYTALSWNAKFEKYTFHLDTNLGSLSMEDVTWQHPPYMIELPIIWQKQK